eukprot:gnl/MRDRNA2_/MRDRNA2_155182_c0_seq1.p2 gnl/MRDRNA2_/MRDRNA2_155182_c0~~gnl/MRDRNA2_/MRDRNA2_155182_c0_seq1.p2  ORF type:complete len:140 (+),score=10.08 gnl/MRDRNA2_/MRDRNA2_155182_c0_seq1:106-525(+)
MIRIFVVAPWVASAYSQFLLTNPTHYGNPQYGCKADEQPYKFRNASGTVCSTPCHPALPPDYKPPFCPLDVPQGVTAKGGCAEDKSHYFCVLECWADNECGAGSCESVGPNQYVCTYPENATGLASTFALPEQQTQLII